MKKITYISELNLPSKSGYALHVLKVCDALAAKSKTTLFTLSCKKRFNKLKFEYCLKNKFLIKSYKHTNENSFLSRILYFFYLLVNIDKNSIIISRSILSSILLSLFKVKNILELHHPPTGLTGVIFKILKLFNFFGKLKFIFLHSNIKKKMEIKSGIILDDATDINDFKYKEKIKYEFSYVGSLFKGKGLEIIIKLANYFPHKKFHIFGHLQTIEKNIFEKKLNKLNNLIFHGFIAYRNIPKILASSKYLLLPYKNIVNVNSKNLEVSKFMSPLKMFDYLASGKIILASNLNVYSHILVKDHNCLMTKKNDQKAWINLIKSIPRKKKKFNNLKRNALKTVSNYTWEKRVNHILNFYKI